ncbi:hypothetical protein CPB84DRAFT_1779594 [Gymnopilus junonius]|uniref:UBX domain-containing protein n=1 Tax=Gymnopilus junonius TaxID=109634 RepID=A0A9P5NK47_GYMJU|nr:hypothetical protein CPB84DRAFT_1779594 [Gymnopilus junonius]
MSASQQQPENFKVYRPPSISPTLPVNDLPDDYFTPTAADLKAAQAVLSARTQALVNAPLKPRSVREAEVKAKRDRWPETTIRVKFMDQTQLEKAFPSVNKIKSVYAFVRGCLREDIKPIKFILYQPPKRDLKVSDTSVRDLTLAELELAPSSILLLRFEDDALNHPTLPAPLAPWVMEQALDLPRPAMLVEETDDTTLLSQTKKVPSSGGKTGEAKVPKWLKLGQRK